MGTRRRSRLEHARHLKDGSRECTFLHKRTTSVKVVPPDDLPWRAVRSLMYMTPLERLNTFSKWPLLGSVGIMAEAGFYYTGISDYIRCYYCALGLRNLDGRDPWALHTRAQPKCDFLYLMKGEHFVENARRKPPTEEEAAEAAAFAIAKEKTFSLKLTGNENRQEENEAENLIRPREKISILKCQICIFAERQTMFKPCRHCIYCMQCALQMTKCPLCRKPFDSIERIYFAWLALPSFGKSSNPTRRQTL